MLFLGAQTNTFTQRTRDLLRSCDIDDNWNSVMPAFGVTLDCAYPSTPLLRRRLNLCESRPTVVVFFFTGRFTEESLDISARAVGPILLITRVGRLNCCYLNCALRCDDIRYDTRCYFTVRSEADTSQLNLPHGTNNRKVEKQIN